MTGPTVPKRKKLTYTVGACQRIRMSWDFFSQNKIHKRKTFKFSRLITLSVKHFVSFCFNLNDYFSQHMKMKKNQSLKISEYHGKVQYFFSYST